MGFIDYLRNKLGGFQQGIISHVGDPLRAEIQRHILNPVNGYFTPTTQVRTRDFVRELPGAARQVGGSLVQGIARSVPAIGGTVMHPFSPASQTPQPGWQQKVFGNEPIYNLKGTVQKNAPVIQQKTGLPSIVAKPLAVAGFALANAPGIGGASKELSAASKAITATEDVGRIAKTLDKLGIAHTPELLSALQKESKATKVEGLLGKFIPSRAKLTGKALETPQAVLDQNAQKFSEVMQSSKRKVVPSTTSEDAKFTADTAQLMNEDKTVFGDSFKKWIGSRETAKTRGAQATFRNISIAPGEGMATIKALEGTGPVTANSSKLRSEFDAAFNEAQKAGIDVNYLKDYVTHIWKETPEQIAQKAAQLGQGFKFSKGRTIPTYEEGLKLGLTPRYDNPQQILGHYVQKLEETKSNLQLFNDLKDKGVIVPAQVGRSNPGFAPIHATGFPQSTSKIGVDTTVIGSWWAPKDVAERINRVFEPESAGTIGKVLGTTANISGKIQDITLSGGIPGTPANAFTFAQSLKEVMGGRIKSPVISFLRSLSPGKTKEFFNTNAEQIIKMQERNVGISSEFNVGDLVNKQWVNKTLGEKVGSSWNAAINSPTFKRFMPMIQVNFFNDVERSLLKGGKSEQEAADIAAQAVKNFYGLTDTASQATRSQLGKDVTSTVLFAPRYRESMVNFWVNNFKGLKKPFAAENRTNTIFLASAAALYAGMNAANEHFNGHGMNENPKGKEDKLLIPLDDGTTVGIPYLSSIATIPRTLYKAGKDVVSGDFKQAGLESRNLLSQLVRPGLDVLSNENYFGKQIYDEGATLGEKVKAGANYVFNPATGSYGHPYIREGVKYLQGREPGYQAASQALELPFRFYDSNKLAMAPIWDDYYKQKQVQDIKDELKFGKIDPTTAAKRIDKLVGSSKGGLPEGQILPYNDSFMYKTSKGYSFADSEAEATLAVEKDTFDKSGKTQGLSSDGSTVFYRKGGKVLDKPKVEYDYALTTKKMQRAKLAKDYKGWQKLAVTQLDSLYQQLQDPSLDELTQSDLLEKADALTSQLKKYQGYGGFTKPKKGKSINIASAKSSIPKFPGFSAPRPQLGSTNKIRVALKQPTLTRAIKVTRGGAPLRAVGSRKIRIIK